MARKSYSMVVPTEKNEEFIKFIQQHNYRLLSETRNVNTFIVYSVSLRSRSENRANIKATLKNFQDNLLAH